MKAWREVQSIEDAWCLVNNTWMDEWMDVEIDDIKQHSRKKYAWINNKCSQFSTFMDAVEISFAAIVL